METTRVTESFSFKREDKREDLEGSEKTVISISERFEPSLLFIRRPVDIFEVLNDALALLEVSIIDIKLELSAPRMSKTDTALLSKSTPLCLVERSSREPPSLILFIFDVGIVF